MWSSPARRVSRRLLGSLAGVALAALTLSACTGPAPAARHALQGWLDDVGAHSVAYAYTLLSTQAEHNTDYDQFLQAVNATHASYSIVSAKEISSADVATVVKVVPQDGGAVTFVRVQMIEEGNAGDWLVAAPFTTEGARAMRVFQ